MSVALLAAGRSRRLRLIVRAVSIERPCGHASALVVGARSLGHAIVVQEARVLSASPRVQHVKELRAKFRARETVDENVARVIGVHENDEEQFDHFVLRLPSNVALMRARCQRAFLEHQIEDDRSGEKNEHGVDRE